MMVQIAMMTQKELADRLNSINPKEPTTQDWEILSAYSGLEVTQDYVKKAYSKFDKAHFTAFMYTNPFLYDPNSKVLKEAWPLPEDFVATHDQSELFSLAVSVMATETYDMQNTREMFWAVHPHLPKIKLPDDKKDVFIAIQDWLELIDDE